MRGGIERWGASGPVSYEREDPAGGGREGSPQPLGASILPWNCQSSVVWLISLFLSLEVW